MVSTTEKLASYVLSATEIQDLTGWPEPMVEEWLNIIRNFANIANDVDTINDREIIFDKKAAQLIAVLNGEISHNQGRFNAHEVEAKNIEQLLYAW